MSNYYTHIKTRLGFMLVLGMASMAWTSTAASNEAVRIPAALLGAMKSAGIPTSAVSIHVQAVESTKPLLSMNAQTSVQPASLMKLITTAAALDLLGPDYRWSTRVYTNGTQNGDVLQGDLIIRGSGDPRFSQQDLWQLLRRLRALGIRQITGDVILDRSLFASYKDDAAQFDQKPERAYNALPDALLLDTKSVLVQLTPDTAHQRVRVTLEPYLTDFSLSAPTLSGGECGDWRTQLGLRVEQKKIIFAGSYALSCGERTIAVHAYPLTHNEYFDSSMRQLWREMGGSVQGVTREGVLPTQAQEITQWQSTALTDAIRDINKFSNNVMARQLLLTLAAERGYQPASKEAGAAVIRQWLIAKGINAAELVIDNGSGLSRADRLSAALLARILQLAWMSPTMPEFIASLPLAGVDGTMRKRAESLSVKSFAHIKTGSLTEVAGIAGYVTTRSGKRMIVVCIVNHSEAGKLKEAMDNLLQWVHENG
jgi:D-alanyl-D-alanine carboxypeptidase/D-alanyl-D-alanine-endopeptidase (penicillin-binding protein 4)